MTQHVKPSPLMAHPSLTGCWQVAGLWFPSEWFDEAARHALLVRHWRPGAIARRFPGGDLLRFKQATLLDCDELKGWPLVADGAVLSSAATLSLKGAMQSTGDVWLVTGGQPMALRWHDGVALDPSDWLDLRMFALHDTMDWSETVIQPQAVPTEARPILEVLNGKVGEPAQAQREFMQALRARGAAASQTQRASTGRRPVGRPGVLPPSVADGLHRVWRTISLVGAGFFLLGLLATLSDAARAWTPLPWLEMGTIVMAGVVWWWLRRPSRVGGLGAGRAHASRQRASGTPATASNGGSLPARKVPWMPPKWRALAERVALLSRFSRVIGMKQARYMQRMLGMFESGDLDQALKHAIPLGGQGETTPAALASPTPRQRLDLHAGPGATGTIGVGDDLQEHLRKLYRRTFEQLKRQQRVDEAVYVLAVLLNARSEALDYLESEGRFTQAAELALSWDMASDVLVRLHCLAGDWRKALAIARRDKAFASAVRLLEGKWPQAAARLRSEWAEALVQQGQWMDAIDAIWPVPEMRVQAVRWLQEAQQAGGHMGGRALAQRAVLLPESLQQHQALLDSLRVDPDLRGERAAIARALLDSRQQGPGVRLLGGLILPMLLHDVASGGQQVDTKSLQGLLNLSGDRFLQADLPPQWPHAGSPDWRENPFDEQAPDAGAYAVFDAVALSGGRWLLALGEAGVMMCDAGGRQHHRFDTPADRLVAGHSAQNALALRRRESLWRVGRLDLVRRELRDLGMLKADRFAPTFDGIAWTVCRHRELLVLDSGRDLAEVLWHVGELPGRVLALSSDAAHEQLLFAPGGGDHEQAPELWTYQLPSRRLIRRDTVLMPTQGGAQLLHAKHGLIDLRCERDDQGGLLCSWRTRGASLVSHRFGPGVDELTHAWVGGGWLLLALRCGHELSIRLLALVDAACVGVVHWPLEEGIGARWSDDGGFTVFDSQGRLMCLDPSASEIRRIVLR